MTRHFVEYWDTRRFFPDSYNVQLETRSVAAALSVVPDTASFFQLYDLPDEVTVPVGYSNVEFRPVYKRFNESGRYFPNGRLYDAKTVEHLAEIDPDEYRILWSNMQSARATHAVNHRIGGWQWFDVEKDVIL